MKRRLFIILPVMLLASIVIAGCAPKPAEVPTEAPEATETPEVTEQPTVPTPTGPVPFSEVGMGLQDAAEVYASFTFEEGKGTCMDQGFPTDMVYDSANIMKTADGSYLEDWTMLDFMGRIFFDELPLEGGAASCTMSTFTDSDDAKVSCTIDEVEVCTATFKVIAHGE